MQCKKNWDYLHTNLSTVKTIDSLILLNLAYESEIWRFEGKHIMGSYLHFQVCKITVRDNIYCQLGINPIKSIIQQNMLLSWDS